MPSTDNKQADQTPTHAELHGDFESLSGRIGPADLAAASLDNPLYYLQNLRTVLKWVLQCYSDLLLAEECALLEGLLELSEPSQALFARLTMRTAEVFKLSALNYAEIPNIEAAVAELDRADWVMADPDLYAEHVFRLCKKDELWALLQEHHKVFEKAPPKSTPKSAMANMLLQLSPKDEAHPMTFWWPSTPFRTVALCHSDLIERVKLMFFGNLYQDWSEFVLTELGYQQYVQVRFTTESRGFSTRLEVDQYLAIYVGYTALANGEDPEDIASLFEQVLENPWLEYRRQKLLLSIAREVERAGDIDTAASLYQSNPMSEAQVRYFRVQEKHCDDVCGLYAQLISVMADTEQPEALLHLGRVEKRLLKKIDKLHNDSVSVLFPDRESNASVSVSNAKSSGDPKQSRTPEISTVSKVAQASSKIKIPIQRITLPRSDYRVEWATLEYLLGEELTSQGCPSDDEATGLIIDPDSSVNGYHCENTLFNGLFALLFWDVLFAPLPGAFFNPFQAGPADLNRPDFVSRREDVIEQTMSTLNDGAYLSIIQKNRADKFGLACALVHWPMLSERFVDGALECIPALHLKSVFTHLLKDLRNHRRGMPDLVIFNRDASTYRLVEVKGPGDRLQDHQTIWIQTMLAEGLPISVAEVRWEADDE